jgi:hypothetical protein
LTGTDRLPDWADATQIQAGENLFWRYGPKQILILNCYALPWDYFGQKGVHVLTLTTRLLSNPTRRITEVSQFLVDVMQPGGLTTPGGRGRRSIQKVRLMHAAVRKLAAESPDWNPAWDLPINQEDLAGTLMSFPWIVLDGLEKLGAALTSDEREAYLHCWKVIGHLLGIRNELLPKNFDSARDLCSRCCNPARPGVESYGKPTARCPYSRQTRNVSGRSRIGLWISPAHNDDIFVHHAGCCQRDGIGEVIASQAFGADRRARPRRRM